jgi:hypothetical protein
VSGDEIAEVSLAPETIEALVAGLAEALGAVGVGTQLTDEDREPQMISAAEVSRRWGVGRRWVYNHADQLGARRLGSGPRPRLRFDAAEVAERLGVPRPAGARSDASRLTPMSANPHSDSLFGRGRAMVGGQGSR